MLKLLFYTVLFFQQWHPKKGTRLLERVEVFLTTLSDWNYGQMPIHMSYSLVIRHGLPFILRSYLESRLVGEVLQLQSYLRLANGVRLNTRRQTLLVWSRSSGNHILVMKHGVPENPTCVDDFLIKISWDTSIYNEFVHLCAIVSSVVFHQSLHVPMFSCNFPLD